MYKTANVIECKSVQKIWRFRYNNIADKKCTKFVHRKTTKTQKINKLSIL